MQINFLTSSILGKERCVLSHYRFHYSNKRMLTPIDNGFQNHRIGARCGIRMAGVIGSREIAVAKIPVVRIGINGLVDEDNRGAHRGPIVGDGKRSGGAGGRHPFNFDRRGAFGHAETHLGQGEHEHRNSGDGFEDVAGGFVDFGNRFHLDIDF